MNTFATFHVIRSKARQRFAALIGLATVAGAFALARNADAAALPELRVIPVTVSPQSFIGAAASGRYVVSAGSSINITETTTVQLEKQAVPGTASGEGHFFIQAMDRRVIDMGGGTISVVNIDLFVTDRRCMLTSVDPALAQSSQLGRLIEITPVLQDLTVIVIPDTTGYIERSLGPSQLASPSSVCTNDSGQLSIDFSAPAFGMVQMTVISHGAGGAARVAATPIILQLGTP
jgi:hypothetical protein